MIKLKQIISNGIEQTASLFTPIALTYQWIHQAADILNNEVGHSAEKVKRHYQNLLAQMSGSQLEANYLSDGLTHFLKITRSYWSGLFHCYEVKDLPRTNNDLEQTFGVLRHHQRRCTGRKVAPSNLVIRGSVQLASALATKIQTFTAEDLAKVEVASWLELRSNLRKKQMKRIEQLRFRRNPQDYLFSLENLLL